MRCQGEGSVRRVEVHGRTSRSSCRSQGISGGSVVQRFRTQRTVGERRIETGVSGMLQSVDDRGLAVMAIGGSSLQAGVDGGRGGSSGNERGRKGGICGGQRINVG